MIVNQIILENTKILVDDTFLPKTKEEKQQRYEIFNQIGCQILEDYINKK